ncbi:MAG: FG-GAP repeat protein, partial [Alcanivoracaceae bacterium]|nr:FG-GAP repeat protein [Alcanivoracaceae bacterium]
MFTKKFILSLGLLFMVHMWAPVSEANAFDNSRPDNISDNKWSSLKFAMQEQKLLPTLLGINAAGDNFGVSVSLSGYRALIGASLDDDAGTNSGAAYVFDYDGSSWSLSQKLVASDGAADDRFGFSVSLSGDRALIGSYQDEHTTSQNTFANSGTAYIFDYDAETSNWSQSQKLNPNDFGSFDEFGIAVSLSGDRALIGAYKNRDAGFGTGSAYIFDYNGSSWSQSKKLTASDAAKDDYFGYAVSLSGDRALIGAYQDDDAGLKPGFAYIFDFNGSSWSQSQKLTAGDGAAEDYFGYAVSLSGDRALIGAYRDDDAGPISGSAYIFDYNGNFWSQSQKLTAGDDAVADLFGYSVSLSGDRALIGAFQDDDTGSNSGSAYIFAYDGSSWSQSQKLTAGDGAANDSFGASVSLSGNRTLIGARRDDDRGTNSGSAYVNKIEDNFEVSVNISGLVAGNSIELLNNGGDNLLVGMNGAAVFPTALIDGADFNVTVNLQPTSPNQTCTITGGNSGQNDGTGQIAGVNYTGINLSCPFVYYVDMNASAGGDGYSWNTAFVNLQDALDVAVSNHEIWVAQGVYYPDVGGGQVDDDRLASFTLIDGVSIYGGFDGTETQLNQRDPETNITILSGDITQDDANLDGNNILEDRADIRGLNSYHIIKGIDVDTSTVFSGFTVTAGQA